MNDIIIKSAFYEFGKSAPTKSGFKGTMSHESLFGQFANYTARDDATKKSVVKEKDKDLPSLMNYTDRDNATKNSAKDGKYFTMTNEGKLYTEDDRKKWLENSKEAFSQPNSIAWQLVVSLQNYDLLEKYQITDQNEMSTIAKLALYRTFNKLHLDPNNFVWWEDYHTNTKHPHMHITFTEKDPTRTKGKFNKKELNMLKTAFMTELVQRKQSYEKFVSGMKGITPKRQKVVSTAKDLDALSYDTLQKIADLYCQLPANSRLQYGASQMIPYRKQLDAIVESILQCESVKTEYDAFKSTVHTLENNINKLGNEDVSNLWKNEDEKLRKQIANAILKNFKEFHENGIDNKYDLKPLSTETVRPLVNIIAKDIMTDIKATDAEKEVAKTILDNDVVKAAKLADMLPVESTLKETLNKSIRLIDPSSSDDELLDSKEKISNEKNSHAKKFTNYSKHTYPLNKANYTGFKTKISPSLKRSARRAIKDRKKEVDDEIKAYLQSKDHQVPISYREKQIPQH